MQGLKVSESNIAKSLPSFHSFSCCHLPELNDPHTHMAVKKKKVIHQTKPTSSITLWFSSDANLPIISTLCGR